MQTIKIFKPFRNAVTAAAAAFLSCIIITEVQSQESPAPKVEGSAGTMKQDTEWDGVSVELMSVTRAEGDTITIKFKYINSGSKTANISQLGQFLAGNVAEHVYYIDSKNKKKYLVVKDAEGKAVASNMSSLQIEASASRSGWAKFPAPPANVDKISVYLPGAPPFEGVTITSQ